MIFKIRRIGGTELRISGRGFRIRKTIELALLGSEVVSLEEEAKETIRRELGIDPEDLITKDTYYFNARKLKIPWARAREEREPTGKFELNYLEEGRNYFCLRVWELDGQLARPSPVWIER